MIDDLHLGFVFQIRNNALSCLVSTTIIVILFCCCCCKNTVIASVHAHNMTNIY